MRAIGRSWLVAAVLLAGLPAQASADEAGTTTPRQNDGAGAASPGGSAGQSGAPASVTTGGGAGGRQPPGRVDAPRGAAPGAGEGGMAVSRALPRPRHEGERCTRGDVGISEARICVSSVLDPQFGNRYGGGNLADGLMRTAWVEGIAGNGIGEFVTLAFERPVPVSAIEVANGYNKSPSIFRKNARVREFTVSASNGFSRRIRLSDKRGWQTLNLPPLGSVRWIMLKVESVYPGIKYADTAISGIALR